MLQFRRICFWLFSEQVHDGAFSSCPLVDGETRAKVAVSADLDGFEKFDGKILAVVADEVVGGSFFAPAMDSQMCAQLQMRVQGIVPVVKGTSLTCCEWSYGWPLGVLGR